MAELEQVNPVSDAKKVSTTDPDATWTTEGGGTAMMAYYDNYLMDTASRVITLRCCSLCLEELYGAA